MKIDVMGTYVKALKNARELIYELERETLITCEQRKFREPLFHGMYIGYSTSINLIDALIRETPEQILEILAEEETQ